VKEAYRKDGEGLFTGVCSDRRRGNGFKLKEGRFRLDMKKKFFILMVVRPWHKLPREAVAAPSLAVLKARLDGALSNLVWWKCPCPWQGGWNQMTFKVPSNPNHSMITRWEFCIQSSCSFAVLPASLWKWFAALLGKEVEFLPLLHGGFIANTSRSYIPKSYCDTHMWILLPLLGQLWYDGSPVAVVEFTFSFSPLADTQGKCVLLPNTLPAAEGNIFPPDR